MVKLWHSELLDVLPKNYLINQWRDLRKISNLLVKSNSQSNFTKVINRILCYSEEQFSRYTELVVKEIERRDYKFNDSSYKNHVSNIEKSDKLFWKYNPDILYQGWFNERYLIQCLHSLQESYDFGEIPFDEWDKIVSKYKNRYNWIY